MRTVAVEKKTAQREAGEQVREKGDHDCEVLAENARLAVQEHPLAGTPRHIAVVLQMVSAGVHGSLFVWP